MNFHLNKIFISGDGEAKEMENWKNIIQTASLCDNMRREGADMIRLNIYCDFTEANK